MKSRQNWNLVLCYQVVAILYTNCSPCKYSASNFPTLYNTRYPSVCNCILWRGSQYRHSVYFQKDIAKSCYVSIGILSEDVSSIKWVLFGHKQTRGSSYKWMRSLLLQYHNMKCCWSGGHMCCEYLSISDDKAHVSQTPLNQSSETQCFECGLNMWHNDIGLLPGTATVFIKAICCIDHQYKNLPPPHLISTSLLVSDLQ